MSFADRALGRERPASIRRNVALPRRQRYFASPVDWRDEVLYFLLVDRFSDAREGSRPLLDRADLASARRMPGGNAWRWDRWAESGASRWQGGTLRGAASKLPYLESLGVTTLWLSPVFKQRGHADSYHGYGVQDFLDVDPRFNVFGWNGVLATAGTPRPVIEKLHALFVTAMKDPEVRKRMADFGFEPIGNTPEEFGTFVKEDIARWAKLVKETGAKVE